jgi:hypothetical protein
MCSEAHFVPVSIVFDVKSFTALLSMIQILAYRNDKGKSRDSSVGIALGCELDDQGSKVRFQVEAGNFSLHHPVQKGSGAHPPSCPMGTRVSFPVGKAAGA